MTEEKTPDELALEDEARKIADNPPEPVAGAEVLPDDVKDGDLSEEEEPA